MAKRGQRKPSERKRQRSSCGFFAYPSDPKHRGDTIERAVRIINENSRTLQIQTWRQMHRTSARIITNILESIKASDVFLADISDLNPNVLFEAGYAFGKRKKTLLFTQGFSTQERERDLKDLDILAGWEIGTYLNAEGIAATVQAKEAALRTFSPEIEKYQAVVDAIPGRGLFLQGHKD